MKALYALLTAGLVVACGPASGTPGISTASPARPSEVATVAPTASPRPTVTAGPTPTAGAICQSAPGEVAVYIDARSNLFGAGMDTAPGPGGGGGGVLPPLVDIPSDDAAVVTFPCTGGKTDCCANAPSTGPDGFNALTDVQSYRGIAGMVVSDRAMFLAGVFIGSGPPAVPAPERLDLGGKLDFERLEPELGQTFFIGDGVGKTFAVPAGASRLYLGFVDAIFFVGEPGYYANNRGALEATVRFATE